MGWLDQRKASRSIIAIGLLYVCLKMSKLKVSRDMMSSKV